MSPRFKFWAILLVFAAGAVALVWVGLQPR